MTTKQAQRAVYVYGIVPGHVELEPEVTGVGDPPSPVCLVRYRDIAALVSDVDTARPLDRPEDLLAHEDLLDATAAAVPVLPMRFGSVVADQDAVTSELLQPHYEAFGAALEQLDGYAEFVVWGRYVEESILCEILAEEPEAADLASQLRDQGADVSQDARMALGELISEAVSAKREQDTRVLDDALAAQVTASVVRPPTHELDAVHTAFLVEAQAGERLQEVLGKLAADWEDRVELRLIGPLAAYDFVGTTSSSASGA